MVLYLISSLECSIFDRNLVLGEHCRCIPVKFTTTGDGRRTGVNVMTTGGAITGDGVAAVVGVAAIKDAELNITAGGALVKETKIPQIAKW